LEGEIEPKKKRKVAKRVVVAMPQEEKVTVPAKEVE